MSTDLESLLRLVCHEVSRAEIKYPSFNSPHEGYAVLKEEVDELWDAVKANNRKQARHEAVHVAAMAVRFLRDVPEEAEDDPTR